jgi:hypothetical protein
MAAVVHLREPLFVFHVTMYGKTNVELYYLNDLHAASQGLHDVVESINLDPASAYIAIATLLNNRIIPLIIAMRAGTRVAHFTALRAPEDIYTAWTTDANSPGADRRTRYNASLLQLGYPTIPTRETPTYAPRTQHPCSSDSTYSPSTPTSCSNDTNPDMTDPSHLATTTGYTFPSPPSNPGTPHLSQHEPHILATDSPLHHSPSSQHTPDSTSQPVHSDSAMVKPEDLQRLVTVLHNKGTITCSEVMTKIVKANKIAFKSWRAKQTASHKHTPPVPSSMDEALHEFKDHPELFIAICRTLPYPDVVLLTRPEKDLTRLGQRLMIEGHKHIFHRLLSNKLTDKARQAIEEWSQALEHAPDFATAWTLLSNRRLGTEARKQAGGLLRAIHTIEHCGIDSSRILICALTHPNSLPTTWKTASLGSVCDSSLGRMAIRDRRPQLLVTTS